MKLFTSLLSGFCAAAMFAGAPAFASANAPSGDAQATAVAPAATKRAVVTDIKAEALVGQPVVNTENDTIGDVESVIVDPSGKVRALVVGVGGFLGIGEREVALAWDSLSVDAKNEHVVVAATEDELLGLPAYGYRDEVQRGTAFEDTRYAMQNEDAIIVDEAGNAVDADSLFDGRGNVILSELVGIDVVDLEGEVVGDIERVVISSDGKVQLVLGAGGFLGIGETQLVLGWEEMEMVRAGSQVSVRTDVQSEKLRTRKY